MPIPIVIAALAAGGTLVAHGAGGFIVTSSAGAYVAGTYISTATVVAILSGGAGLIAGGVAAADAHMDHLANANGHPGSRMASGVDGISRSAGTTSSAPAWVSSAAAGIRAGGRDAMGYATGQVYRMRKMAEAASEGVEVRFTDSQARVLQFILLQLPEAR